MGPWSKGQNVRSPSQAFIKDYLHNYVWEKPLGYITIARHLKGVCTMSKTWKLLDNTWSLYDYFSSYPGRFFVTGDGGINDTHIASDIPTSANGLSGTWKDPIFGADGGLVFNWYYGNNGVRIGVPGGRYTPYILPEKHENTDDFHGLGNEFEGQTATAKVSTGKWWHDAAKIGPKCFGVSCQMIGTDHGVKLKSEACWGSYAIYVSQDATTFICQNKTLSSTMT